MRQYKVPALDKAMAMLEALSASPTALSATDLHGSLGIPKASAFMILNVLARHDMVRRTADGRYGIGIKAFELGRAYIARLDLVEIAHPHLQALTHDTHLTSHLGIVHDGGMLIVTAASLNPIVIQSADLILTIDSERLSGTVRLCHDESQGWQFDPLTYLRGIDAHGQANPWQVISAVATTGPIQGVQALIVVGQNRYQVTIGLDGESEALVFELAPLEELDRIGEMVFRSPRCRFRATSPAASFTSRTS